MSGVLSLNGTWGLTYSEDTPDHYTGTRLEGRRLLQAAVPAPIHQVLMQAGLLDDPNFGMNSLKARWVEEQFWIYRYTFAAPPEALAQSARLVFERLELEAVVFLNGAEVGRHANAHRPARFDVTGKLHEGENLLVVKIESGLHAANDKPASDYATDWYAKMSRRPWQRKPQYQCGWDWNPRLMNVGILGDVRLEWSAAPRLEQVTVFAVPRPDLSAATVTVRVSVDAGCAPTEGTLRARIVETGQEVSQSVSLKAGEQRLELMLEIENPRLWWPIGHGEQNFTTVEVTLEAGGETQAVTRRTGVRRVEIDQSPHPVEGQYCILKINNRPIFCKGGNWVPADLLYSTVTPARVRELVELAVLANFNLLRVWGGGLFADPTLCDACDEAGILLWHDFLFACAKYPGDFPEFAAEVRRETTYAVREMAHHPALVVWCGNNEIEEGDWEWGYDTHVRTHPHYALFHHDIPKIVRTEDLSKVHWLSSPWSPDYKSPNDPTVGDQHPWKVSLGEPGGADFWHYRGYVDRFPNEGGVLGASSPATLRQFLPENERYLLSSSWQHHDNTFASLDSNQGELGHAYQTVRLWTGRDPLAMDLDEYAFVSGLLHAEGLQEYILNYRRRMFSSASAIFWMFNDSWPVTHGWTILDYYLRKKLAFHPVRRAFQSVTVVCAKEEENVGFTVVNETAQPWKGKLLYGAFDTLGERIVNDVAPYGVGANEAKEYGAGKLWNFFTQRGLNRTGAFAVLYDRNEKIVAQHRQLFARFHELDLVRDPKIDIQCEKGVLTLKSDVFVWGVCLDVDGELPLADNCFDLLPGIPYSFPWPDELGSPHIVRLGNRDAVRL